MFGVPGDRLGGKGLRGPRSSTDIGIARWKGTKGKLLQDSAAFVTDAGVLGSVVDDSTTSTVLEVLSAYRTSSGTPANGIGAALGFHVEANVGNTKLGALIAAVVADVTLASEDFDIAFYVMTAGAAAAEKMRLKSTGHLVVNNTAEVSVAGSTGALAVFSDITVDWGPMWFGNGAALSAPAHVFVKSRNATPGSHTALLAGDQIGGAYMYGSDGSNYVLAGGFLFQVDANAGAGICQGSMLHQWTDGAGTGITSWLPKTRRLASLHTVSSTTATEVTGLSLNGMPAGSYIVEWYLLIQSDTAGTGLTFSVNFSGTVTKMSAMCFWPDTGVTAALGAVDDAANVATGQIVAHSVTNTKATSTTNLSTGTTGVATATTTCLVRLTAMLDVSTAGDIELWHGSEAATATRIEVGSSVMCTRTA